MTSKNIVGNPTNYISVATAAPKDTAAAFLKTTYSDTYVQGLIEKGEVPGYDECGQAALQGARPGVCAVPVRARAEGPNFTQSWDQALGLTLGTPLLTEIQKLFNGQSSSAAVRQRGAGDQEVEGRVHVVSATTSRPVTSHRVRDRAAPPTLSGRAWPGHCPGCCSSSSSPSRR
ncbi:hypothetical protein ACRAWF_15420 [Streptomyces sp. L7]